MTARLRVTEIFYSLQGEAQYLWSANDIHSVNRLSFAMCLL